MVATGTFQTRNMIEKLQTLVSSDGRFRNLRDALHRTDPPCIPYLGMYLSDLTFIEEGTPNFTDNGLLNFAKMRMVSQTDAACPLFAFVLLPSHTLAHTTQLKRQHCPFGETCLELYSHVGG